jgi:hypothetical protein
MPDKWDKKEEEKLIKEISKGIDIKEIAEKHGRSYNAVELRMKKIIYDNLIENYNENKEKKIAKIFKMPVEMIRKYYNDYKIFLEQKQEKKEENQEKKDKNNKDNKDNKDNNKIKKIEIIKEQNDKMRTIIDNIKLREEMEIIMKKKKNKKIAENISKIL